MAHHGWRVRLGIAEWARFTYARSEGDPLRLLGSVRCGARMGALAVTADSTFVQVNGDYLTPLNASQIRCALAKADVVAATAKAPVAVIIKRRRRTMVDSPK